jgi:hypothetical protein
LNLRPCFAISVQHLDGSAQFKTEGKFLVGTSNGDPVYVACYAVSIDQLPDAMTAMFGMPAIATLGLSLDFIMVNPLCLWAAASSLPSLPSDHDGPLDFLDAPFSEDSDTDSELPDLLETSSDGFTISTESTDSLTITDLSFVTPRTPLPVPAIVTSAVISVPVPALLPALVPPTVLNPDAILGPTIESEAAVFEPLQETSTPDVSVQPRGSPDYCSFFRSFS